MSQFVPKAAQDLAQRARRLSERLANRTTNAVDQDVACVEEESLSHITDMPVHGMANPLDWENLPPLVKSRLDSAKHDVRSNSENGISYQGNGRCERKRNSRRFAQPKGTIQYTAQVQDTLVSIAAQFDTTTSELKKLNKLMGTDMIFSGQTIYVPDPDYMSSSSSSPMVSPSEPDKGVLGKSFPMPVTEIKSQPRSEVPMVKQAEKPEHGPGHAERLPQQTRNEGDTDPSRPLSHAEAKRLDEECYERFIKVNVKHITDGQGVVNGVLLVTPNAIMFDPNVSDPLVIEHSADKYGMIAPMDTVITAAMYHDISAMRFKHSSNKNKQKPEIYHDTKCALYRSRCHSNDDSNKNALKEKKPEPDVNMCSCGVETPSDTEHRVDQQATGQTTDNVSKEVEEADDAVFEPEPEAVELDVTEPSPIETQVCVNNNDVVNAKSDVTNQKSVCDGEDSKDDNIPLQTESLDSSYPENNHANRTAGVESDNQNVLDGSGDSTNYGSSMTSTNYGSSPTAGSESIATDQQSADMNKNIDEATDWKKPEVSQLPDNNVCVQSLNQSSSPHTQIGNIQYFSYEDIEREASLSSGNAGGRDAGETVVCDSGKDVPAASGGILRRTLGSLGSMTSISNAPGFSKIVDLSSGLFTRVDEDRGNVKDISEVETKPPPRSVVWYTDMDEGSRIDISKSLSDTSRTPSVSREGQTINKRHSTQERSGAGMDVGSREQRSRSEQRSIDIEVESAVKLDDKPELFRSLDELIPRPATLYEDPPLYLCLKVGVPINKQVSKTCPIEAYRKNKKKPEYWFSVPRDKVDALYAFFVQWSPEIYGDADDFDPVERGFVVIDESDGSDENSVDLVEDHFKSETRHRLVRQVTKDWEIVNLEEARRRLSCMEDDYFPLPELLDCSAILNSEHIRQLSQSLPARAEGYPWSLLYSSERNGFSLKTLYRAMGKVDCPVLLVVKDTVDQVFGAMLSCVPKMCDHFCGTGESYLFTFCQQFKKFSWTGSNNFFIKGNAESLAIGAGEGSFGLWLDGDLYHGRTQPCQTYANEILTVSEDFVVQALEVWGFV